MLLGIVAVTVAWIAYQGSEYPLRSLIFGVATWPGLVDLARYGLCRCAVQCSSGVLPSVVVERIAGGGLVQTLVNT